MILVRVPSDPLMLYGRADSRVHGRPFPDLLQILYAGVDALTVARVDDRTLDLTSASGWLYAPLDRLHRDPRADPFAVGQQIHHAGLTIEILAITPGGAPARVRVRFDRPLEQLAWYAWSDRTPEPYAPPAIGGSNTLPARRNPMLGL